MSDFNLPPPSDACLDIVDSRDYSYSEFQEIAGVSVENLPKRVLNNRTSIQNQGIQRDPSSSYFCCGYAGGHTVNEANYIEAERNGLKEFFTELQIHDLIPEAIKRGFAPKIGWSLQGAAKMYKDLGYTTGYTSVQTSMQAKVAVAEGRLIVVGTRLFDWTKTYTNKDALVSKGEGYGHSFCICGYDDELHGGCWILRNSYGTGVPIDGLHYLKYSDWALLFQTKYIYHDADDKDTMKKLAKKKRLEEALKLGFWNGRDADRFATRFEAAQVVMRKIASMDVTPIPVFWNSKDPDKAVTRQEVQWMFEKALSKKFPKNIDNPMKPMLRGDVVEFAMII